MLPVACALVLPPVLTGGVVAYVEKHAAEELSAMPVERRAHAVNVAARAAVTLMLVSWSSALAVVELLTRSVPNPAWPQFAIGAWACTNMVFLTRTFWATKRGSPWALHALVFALYWEFVCLSRGSLAYYMCLGAAAFATPRLVTDAYMFFPSKALLLWAHVLVSAEELTAYTLFCTRYLAESDKTWPEIFVFVACVPLMYSEYATKVDWFLVNRRTLTMPAVAEACPAQRLPWIWDTVMEGLSRPMPPLLFPRKKPVEQKAPPEPEPKPVEQKAPPEPVQEPEPVEPPPPPPQTVAISQLPTDLLDASVDDVKPARPALPPPPPLPDANLLQLEEWSPPPSLMIMPGNVGLTSTVEPKFIPPSSPESKYVAPPRSPPPLVPSSPEPKYVAPPRSPPPLVPVRPAYIPRPVRDQSVVKFDPKQKEKKRAAAPAAGKT